VKLTPRAVRALGSSVAPRLDPALKLDGATVLLDEPGEAPGTDAGICSLGSAWTRSSWCSMVARRNLDASCDRLRSADFAFDAFGRTGRTQSP